MARTSLSSLSIPFLILLIITFTFFAQLAPVSAGLSISLKDTCKDMYHVKKSEDEKIGSHAKSTSFT
ncbi:hypothetical protein JHK82_018020 [Glycine max]|uniref:Uncharacterized protein n=2 Tax=Glycine subgen. Soja TaxID=1462606 RepID=K7L0R4_SOYBN|nr:hypothetical protein JHK87_017962 [Glycine soja]KAG5022151.1 hypothetical protein JHK85_018493 [Glycine max]KAG5142325.1 hypothetical protein JHK82_018020 [Glycine max]RZC02237.1 hypothetical protein D0Y65_017403 [Glycine soja]